MRNSIVGEVARLRAMTIAQLRVRYAEVFGEEPRSRNKDYLWKRIAYRIQEMAEGSITERAQRRAEELARDAELRVRGGPTAAEVAAAAVASPPRDSRLPLSGTVIHRNFAGKEHAVQVLEDGFEYDGRRFKSLSSVARAIAGSRWNGFLFFGLGGAAGAEEAAR